MPTDEKQDERRSPPSCAVCEHPDCRQKGEYPAPKSRLKSDGYKFFCLEHVRAYNRRWDYFANMSVNQVNSYNRRAAVLMRPTWPLNGGAAWYVAPPIAEFYGSGRQPPSWTDSRPSDVRAAMRLFGIDKMTSFKELKARYRLLVKSNHPDVHRGEKPYIRRIQAINSAYNRLKKWHLSKR